MYGGIGYKFDWSVLDCYEGKMFFFFSGGIGLNDVKVVWEVIYLVLVGVDLNSRFEIELGLKDVELLCFFIDEFKDKK